MPFTSLGWKRMAFWDIHYGIDLYEADPVEVETSFFSVFGYRAVGIP